MAAFHRPRIHFSPSTGWMNDPNGLIFYNDLWHFFYQYHPHSSQWGPMHWGHAVSSNLIDWEHWPIALDPDELGAIWSGSADVVRSEVGEALVACFTYQTPELQSQGLAFSEDGGRTFEKYAENPVLKGEISDFRDPKIFRYGEEWRMILAAGPEALIYASHDLKEWQLLSRFAGVDPSWVWECPDLFLLDGQWVLIGSFHIADELPRESCYWVGEFDGQQFVASGARRSLGFGPDDYAGITWNNAPEGRRVLIAWMNGWEYAGKTTEYGARGAATLPRELSLRDGKLYQNPVPELKAKRGVATSLDGLNVTMPIGTSQGQAFEIEAQIVVGEGAEVGFGVCLGEQGVGTYIGFDATQGELYIDRARSGEVDFHSSFASRYSVPCGLEGGNLDLRIVVDSSSVEVFCQNGEFYGAALIFPPEEAQGIEFFVRGGEANIQRGCLFPLSS